MNLPIDKALRLVKEYTRESYLAEFGKQAPPADASRPYQDWIGEGAFHRYIDGVWTEFNASGLNLPGKYDWPHTYKANQIKAVWVTYPDGTIRHPWDTEALSTHDQAIALQARIAADCGLAPTDPLLPIHETKMEALLIDDVRTGKLIDGYSVKYTDPGLRMFEIGGTGNMDGLNVGLALKAEQSSGDGYPGKWTHTGGFHWIAAPYSEVTGPGQTLAPQRELAANERIVQFGPGFYFVTTDPEPGTSNSQSGTGTEAITQSVVDKINAIYAAMKVRGWI